MGSITQAPKAPAAASPQVIYYTPSTPYTADPATPTDNGSTPQQQSETRAQNLLRRDRGRLGTILTGFRGILGLSNDTPSRKTLLGE
jgi:hypothetical protein